MSRSDCLACTNRIGPDLKTLAAAGARLQLWSATRARKGSRRSNVDKRHERDGGSSGGGLVVGGSSQALNTTAVVGTSRDGMKWSTDGWSRDYA